MSAGLNLAQLQAVHYTDGACLVLAGAGSGKTRVITMKIAHMIEKGMDPKRIAAITFTNKAASEMRERAGHLIGKRAKDVLICTFHALACAWCARTAMCWASNPSSASSTLTT